MACQITGPRGLSVVRIEAPRHNKTQISESLGEPVPVFTFSGLHAGSPRDFSYHAVKTKRFRSQTPVRDPSSGKEYFCRTPEEAGWIDMLKVMFHYDPVTGVVRRRIKFNKSGPAGSVVGVPTLGYLRVTLFGKSTGIHMVIWAIMTGKWPNQHVDHVNGQRSDNRWCNLRLATRGENLRNSRKPEHNTSGAKGVSWSAASGKWHAYIGIDRRRVHLGFHDTVEEAAHARKVAEQKYYGEFSGLKCRPGDQ